MTARERSMVMPFHAILNCVSTHYHQLWVQSAIFVPTQKKIKKIDFLLFFLFFFLKKKTVHILNYILYFFSNSFIYNIVTPFLLVYPPTSLSSSTFNNKFNLFSINLCLESIFSNLSFKPCTTFNI